MFIALATNQRVPKMEVKCQNHEVCSKSDWSIKYRQSQNGWSRFLPQHMKAVCPSPFVRSWRKTCILQESLVNFGQVANDQVIIFLQKHLHHHVCESNMLVDVSCWWEYHVARLVYHDGENIMLAIKCIMLVYYGVTSTHLQPSLSALMYPSIELSLVTCRGI